MMSDISKIVQVLQEPTFQERSVNSQMKRLSLFLGLVLTSIYQ